MTDSIKRSKDKRVIRTKAAIRSALFEALQEKEISELTITELSAAAGVNRRTFYTHYSNVSDILTEIEGELITRITELVENADFKDVRNTVKSMFLGLHALVSEEFGCYFRLMENDDKGMLLKRLKAAISRSKRSFGKNPLLAAFVTGGIVTFYREWYNQEETPDKLSAEAAAELCGKIAEGCSKKI